MDDQRADRVGGSVAPSFHQYVQRSWELYERDVLTASELSHRLIEATWEHQLNAVEAFPELPNQVREVMWSYFGRLNQDHNSILHTEVDTEYHRYFKASVLAILGQK